MVKRSDQGDDKLRRQMRRLGPDSVLYEVGARDEWQTDLVTSDGAYGGTIVRKIVEPASYMVRYLVLFRPDKGLHMLLPANTVVGAQTGEVLCLLSSRALDRLPPYHFETITRRFEEELYAAIGVTPYWIEEETGRPNEGEEP